MKTQNILPAACLLIFFSCTKDPEVMVRQPQQPVEFNYTWPANWGGSGISSKKLKIKVVDVEAGHGLKDAIFYLKATARKTNCIGISGCDSTLYEDSVVTDTNGEAITTKRGNSEMLRDVKGYWTLHGVAQTYSFLDYDSTVFRLWPEVWVKIYVKNINPQSSDYLFSPRLECTKLGFVYQPAITINKDTTIIQRLWANQDYKISLNLYKNVFGTFNSNPVVVLKEFTQYIGKDTTELTLSY